MVYVVVPPPPNDSFWFGVGSYSAAAISDSNAYGEYKEWRESRA